VIEITFDNPQRPTAPIEVVRAIGAMAIVIGKAAAPVAIPLGDVIILLTTHFNMKGLVIPNSFPTVKNAIDFHNFPIESL